MTVSPKMKISVFMALSLDGFIARPDGDVAWLHEGEALPEGDDAGFGAFFNSIDVLVMGRGSFEKVLEFDEWAYGSKPIVVMSKTLKTVPKHLRETVAISSDSPQALIATLSEQGYQHMYLDGGKLIQSFLREGLVNEMTLTTIPVLIGQGIPLFAELNKDVHLKHLNTRTWENGFVQTHYRLMY
ncbi:MAG: dihydrofolate reductase family protein [Phototrophicaceae bacterium]